MLCFLVMSLVGVVGFACTEDYTVWLLCRLAFGGGLGMFFRVVEYWLNTTTQKKNRGRVIGIYSACFLLGIAIGSLLQPVLGTEGSSVFALVGLPIFLGGGLLSFIRTNSSNMQSSKISFSFLKSVMITAPLAMAGVVTYGLFEDVPAYLLSVYTLQLGLGENIAAYTLTAVALGNLCLSVPLGIASDRIGRTPVLLACACIGLVGSVVIPLSTGNTAIYLGFLAIWGGFVGGLYIVSLAHIGDHFSDDALIAANAAFGFIYAAAAMVGPLINGSAMQLWEPNGLMVACAAIFGGFLLFACSVHKEKRVKLSKFDGVDG